MWIHFIRLDSFLARVLRDCNLLNMKPHSIWNARSPLKRCHAFYALLIGLALYTSFCECWLVDLSHAFDESTFFWRATEKPLRIIPKFNGTYPGKTHWYKSEGICADTTHSGTHLDAPCHVAKGKWCVTDIPLEHLVVPAVVIDISRHVGDNPNVHLTLDHVLDWEREHGLMPRECLFLVHTGWSRYWPDRAKYLGTASSDPLAMKFPSISGEVATWLVRNRNVVGVGVDSMSIDVNNQREETHLALFENNIYGLENLRDLHLLPPTGTTVYVMPTKLKAASGAPCRVVAFVPY